MRELIAEPLTAASFAPFGDVLMSPATRGRVYFNDSLGNGRPQARPSLSVVRVPPLASLPLEATLMERHEFSSQSFMPISVSRWLVVVAPGASGGGPDMARACAFIAGSGQGLTYRMNTWHHGVTVLDREAEFAVFMWADGSKGDEEFVPIAPISVRVPE